MTIGQLAVWFIGQLEPIYGDREARAIQRYFFRAILNISSSEWLLRKDENASSEFITTVKDAVVQLAEKVPVQYIIGKSWFCELELVVNPDVLIPRPETEELVHRIVTDFRYSKKNRVLDIGTGSGAIAIALAKLAPQFQVSAVDISEKALAVAINNALLNNVDVKFFEFDILKYAEVNRISPQPFAHSKYDIIVSNPPYVKESEQTQMEDNVLKHEPHLALFVSDKDPLIYYRAVINFSELHLGESGYIYLEINESEADNLRKMLNESGFSNVEIIKDLNDKDRFIKASK